jgi:Apea-like HEPN
MFLQFSIGSKGAASAAYSIRIPITPAPGQKLDIGEGVCFTYEHFHVEIVRERYFYSLTVGEFSSEAQGLLWLCKFSVALLWIVAKLRLGLIFESTAEGMELFEEPITLAPNSPITDLAKSVGWRDVDGFYSADKTVIRPEHKKLISDLTGRPTVIIGTGFANFVEVLEEGLRYAKPNTVLTDRKLRLAFEIYASSFFESSRSARFLTLMTALEAIAESASRPAPVIDCLEGFMNRLKSRREELVRLVGAEEFESLAGSLRNLQEKSIGQKIRTLLKTKLAGTPEAVHIPQFSHIYEIRSRLVHQGLSDDTEVGSAISTLDNLVPAILRRLLLEAVTGD